MTNEAKREKVALYLIACWGKHQKPIDSLDDLDEWHRNLWLHRADSLIEFMEDLASLPKK